MKTNKESNMQLGKRTAKQIAKQSTMTVKQTVNAVKPVKRAVKRTVKTAKKMVKTAKGQAKQQVGKAKRRPRKASRKISRRQAIKALMGKMRNVETVTNVVYVKPEECLTQHLLLRDVLYNTAPDSSSTPDYANGVVMGVMAGLQASGKSHEESAIVMGLNLPYIIRPECFTTVLPIIDTADQEIDWLRLGVPGYKRGDPSTWSYQPRKQYGIQPGVRP